MGLLNSTSISKFETLACGNVQEAYNYYQLNNFNVSGLIFANIVLLILLSFAPRFNAFLESYNDTIALNFKNKSFEVKILPDIERVITSALFLLNFSSAFVYLVVPHV